MNQAPAQHQRIDSRYRGNADRRSVALSVAEDLRSRANRLGMGDIVQSLLAKGSNEELVRDLLERLEALRIPVASPTTAQAAAFGSGYGPPRVRTFAEAPRSVTLPRARVAETWERALIEAAIVALPFPGATTLISGLRVAADRYDVAFGIGPSAGAGFALGVGVGAGIILARGGQLGVYGSFDVRAGLIDSVSAGLQITIVGGGVEAFNGIGFALGAAVEAGVSVSAQVLFDGAMRFQGVSFELGVGIGVEPIEVYLAAQRSGSVALALAAESQGSMAGRGAPRARGPLRLAAPPPPVQRARAFGVGAFIVETLIMQGVGWAVKRLSEGAGKVTWTKDRLEGFKRPEGAPRGTVANGPAIELTGWPRRTLDTPFSSDAELGIDFKVTWQFDGRGVGNVYVEKLGEVNRGDLWSLNVDIEIRQDDQLYVPFRTAGNETSGDRRCVAVPVHFTYNFSNDFVAKTVVTLYGDGTYQQSSVWTQAPSEVEGGSDVPLVPNVIGRHS